MDKKAFVCTYGWYWGVVFVNPFLERSYSLVFLKQCVCWRLCGAMLEMGHCDAVETKMMIGEAEGESSTGYPQSVRLGSLDFRKGAERLRAELAESHN
jgi:hypothetical protein